MAGSFVTDDSLATFNPFANPKFKRQRESIFSVVNTDNTNEKKTLEFWLQGSYPVSENSAEAPKRSKLDCSEIQDIERKKLKKIAIIEAFKTIKELTIEQIRMQVGLGPGFRKTYESLRFRDFIEAMVEEELLDRTSRRGYYRLAYPTGYFQETIPQ